MIVLQNRRSIRGYSDKPITEELLNDILEVASRASTTGNMQLYAVIVTRDQNMKDKLSPLHFNQPMIKQAPVVLTFCADFNRFNKWCLQNNAQPGYNNFQSFLTAMIDTTLFAEHFAVAAESQGLGICYLGTTTYNAGEIIDVLNIPKSVIPITTIALGYPAIYPEQVERLPLDGFVHIETYHDYSNADIENIYHKKENLPVNIKFVQENNKESLAQVFTEVRYTKANNELFSEKFLKVLKKQGFIE